MGNRISKGLSQGLQPSRHPLALAIAVAMAATPAWAEEEAASDQEELQTIEVSAEQREDVYGGDDFGYVGQRGLTATKTDTPVRETPRSVSIVTREQMDDRASISVADALQYTPSIQANFYGEDNKQDWFVIRGFKQANAGLYRDGTRTYSDGFYSWQIDPFSLERVEILRGPASVLYGQTPPGGVINLVSKRPQDYSFGSVGVEYGSYDRKQLSVDVGAPVGDGHAFRMVALARENGTQVDDLEAERTLFAPSFKLNLGDKTDLTLLATYQKDDSDPYLQFLPGEGTIERNKNGYISDETAVGNPDFERFDRTQYTLGYQLDHAFSDQTSFQQSVRYGHIDIDLMQAYSLGYTEDLSVPDGMGGRIPVGQLFLDPAGERRDIYRGVSTEDGEADTWTVDNRLIHKWSFNNIDHTLLVGVDYQDLSIEGKDYASDPILADGNSSVTVPLPGVGALDDFTFDVYNPRYSTNPVLLNSGTFGRLSESDRQTRTIDSYQVGGYIQDQMKIDDRFIVLLGARYDHAKQEFENEDSGVEYESREKEWSTSAGLAYLFGDHLTAYASYAQFFQPVGIQQIQDSDQLAKPIRGDQVELGLKLQPEGVDGYFNAAVFQITQENMPSGSGVNLTQIGEVRNRGIELEAVTNITPSFSLLANTTFMDPEIRENGDPDQVGNRPEQVADTLGSLWAKYSFLDGPISGFSVGSGVRYVGKTYGGNYETLDVPSITLWDATVSYRWKDFKFQVAAKNLEDKEYVATCSSGGYFCWYGDRRNVIGSVTYAW
ncbi:MAG: TonB-dependent siderophore receptor [Alcanivorax sp.]|uniref:TonB-dependent siderophore receptor n=1 Tax=Alcanivorax sp. TaxID=1872427 RepID=UPI003DA6D49A